MNTKNDHNDYHFRPTTNGRFCSRHSRTSLKLSSPLAEGWAFHPGGDSAGTAMGRRHPRTDLRRRVKGHTQLLHQPSLIVSAAVSSEQTTDHSLLRKRKSSIPPLLLLSHKTFQVLWVPKAEWLPLHAAFVLTVQFNRDRFQGYGRHQHQSVVL